MNERIQELAQGNERILNFFQTGPVQRAAIEDFVEAIVQKCIEQAHKVSELRGATEEMIYGADTAALRIAMHFGVK